MGRQFEPVPRSQGINLPNPADSRSRSVRERDNSIAQEDRFVYVVRDHYNRGRGLFHDANQFVLKARLGQRIERAERLVQQQHLRLDRKSASDAHPLLHST